MPGYRIALGPWIPGVPFAGSFSLRAHLAQPELWPRLNCTLGSVSIKMRMERACWILESPVLSLGVRVTGPRPLHGQDGQRLQTGNWTCILADWAGGPSKYLRGYLSWDPVARLPWLAYACDFTPHPVLELCGAAAFRAVTSSVPVEVRLSGSGRSTALEYLPPRSHSLYPEPRGVLRRTHVAREPPPLAGQALPTDKSGLVTNG